VDAATGELNNAMPMELRMLGASIALGLVYVLAAAALGTVQRGLKWNAGNRDGTALPLTGMAGRASRANANFLETFAFFAAAVIAVVVGGRTNAHTALGTQVYFWARLAYLPVYLIGIPYLRTAIWATAFWGMLQVLEALF
jgi:uncharacterized MAPEG superfamily protein